jgi:hypothetical protein
MEDRSGEFPAEARRRGGWVADEEKAESGKAEKLKRGEVAAAL